MTGDSKQHRRMIRQRAESLYRAASSTLERLEANRGTPAWLTEQMERVTHLAFILRAQARIDENNAPGNRSCDQCGFKLCRCLEKNKRES